jgi:hypothetical protein
MTEPAADRGLGAIDSPPDERDWSIDTLYATAGLEPVAIAPPSYMVPPPYPPVLNQHATPMCVAYSSALLKGYEDLRDTGAVVFDEPAFFTAIGGGPNGAIIRNALAELLGTGYPVTSTGQPGRHKIAAYYRVPVDKAAIQSALMTFGPVLIGTPWFNSWFRPVSGILPSPDVQVGGHAIVAVGWDTRGLRLRNSWGTGYALAGDVFLPWSLLDRVREAWKAVDQVIVPPPTVHYRIRIAPHALVKKARMAGGCIAGWDDERWGGTASGAACKAPVIKKGCFHGQATVALVTAGKFKNKFIHIGRGVTLVAG